MEQLRERSKRALTLLLAIVMILTSLPLDVLAKVNHENLTDYKAKIINNKVPVKPAKPEAGKTAKDIIKNPDQPDIYTKRYEFQVPVETRYKPSYQPYIASVGAAASDAEKAKVNKTIDMPKLAGFTAPDDLENFNVTYDKVKDGNNYPEIFKYEGVNKTIQVDDVFQDINDFNKYVSTRSYKRIITGSTDSALQISSLQNDEIKGFVPEKGYITVQLPSDTDNFVVEYRYNRNHYEATFDTDGGTPVQAREFFYGQTIPALDASELPTKDGFKFTGWTATPILKDASGTAHSVGNLKPNLSGGLIMPAEPVKFKAVWTADSSAKEVKPTTKDTYNVKLDYGDGRITTTPVNHEDVFNNPGNPRRDAYTFMGWAWLDKSNTNQVLYSFNNKVTSDINLKAIWVKNGRVDVDIYHYFLDKDGNKDNSKYPNPLKETLYDKRAGNYSTTVGDQISDKYTLASPDDIKDANIKSIFDTYNKKYGFNNSFFQKIMVKENNSNGDNEFYFFYRPFREREYNVNYIDERGKAEVEKFFKDLNLIKVDTTTEENEILEANKENKKKFDDNKDKLEKIIEKYKIVDAEHVVDGNRHYDARNYRPIPGWKLVSAPQQQLFFDVNEKTNEFLGINGTGSDQIFFYYKDVRIIEVPDNENNLDDYVKVTFKADDGGSFGKDNKGNDIKEIKYYVIKGLMSNFLPIPGDPTEDSNKDKDKYYITPDNGRRFKEWEGLLNANTDIQQDYTFTAKFDWSGLSAKDMVITEAYKDANGEWTNDFAPKFEDLKKQIVWMENGQEKPLPADATVTFEGITSDNDIYEKLKELGVSDAEEVFRIVTFKATVEFKNNSNKKEVEFSIKVYKNRYEALTSGDKPLPLSEAEKGDLKDILSDTTEKRYVKVTVNPSNRPNNKDSKIYYVNPNAWVDIPELVLSNDDKAKLRFLNWTSDDITKNDDGKANGNFDFGKRFKFTKDTIISPVSAEAVIEQKGSDKPIVPESYVKVIVKTTDNATTETAFERTFWVDPLNKVEIAVDKPTGKKIESDTTPYTLIFSKWQTEDTSKSWTDKILGQFEKDTTILAKYSTKFEDIKVQMPTVDAVDTPQGKVPTLDEIKAKITPPAGKTIASVEYITNGEPDVTNDGKAEAKVIVKYTDGSTAGTEKNPIKIPVEVHKNIIPSYDGNMPEGALNNYVKITFKAGEGGTITDGKKKAYFVSPEVEVDMTSIAEGITKTPNTGYINGDWDTSETKKLKDTFKADTEFTFKFIKTKDIVVKTDDSVKKPEGYAELIFETDGNGKLDETKDKIIYYVNPEAGVKIVNGQAGDKQIAVPTPKANANYVFDKWYEELDTINPITADRDYVANFNLINVTLTYDANGAIGQGPSAKTVKYGTKEFLANQEKLTKENYNFIGWKLSTDNTGKIYQAGDDIILKENTTATAQWKIIQHTVSFNTMGGSDIDSQDVDHGSKATKPVNPTKAGFVFMGWKEQGKENDNDYYNFDTKITADKTLVAIWEKAVQKIGENDPVGEEFIKVTFKEGTHGKLTIDDAEQTDSPTYKVGKDLSFEDAVKYGLVVPTIKAKEYYKAKEANAGWDKPLALNGQSITFTAQYEVENSVIPIKPEKTDEEIQKEKPEGMIVVDFTVDANRAYMVGTTKFYVKKSEAVNIPAPLVVKTDLSYYFKGWNTNTEDESKKVSFEDDTTIGEAAQGKPDIEIRAPRPGQNFIELIELTNGATGHLTIVRGSEEYKFTNIEVSKKIRIGRRIRTETIKGFDLSTKNITIEAGDRIMYYAENGDLKSEIRELLIR